MVIIRLIITFSFLALLTHTSAHGSESENLTAKMLGATHVAPVFFDPGMHSLSQTEKDELKNFLDKIKAKDSIASVKVLVWADQEYPDRMKKASSQQVKLAKSRAKRISEYLSNDLSMPVVETHNMAVRPSKLSEVLRSEDYAVKASAEKAGVAPKQNEIGFFEEMGRSTTALVLVVIKIPEQAQANKRSPQFL